MKGLELAAVSVAFVGTWRHTSGLLMQGCIRYSSLVSVFVVEEISSSSCGSQLCTAVKWTYRKMFFSTLNKSHLKKYTSASANTMFWTFLVLYVAVKPPFSFGTTFPQPYNFSIHDGYIFFKVGLILFFKMLVRFTAPQWSASCHGCSLLLHKEGELTVMYCR